MDKYKKKPTVNKMSKRPKKKLHPFQYIRYTALERSVFVYFIVFVRNVSLFRVSRNKRDFFIDAYVRIYIHLK